MDNLSAAWTWVRGEILTYPMWGPAAVAAVIAQGTILGWWNLDGTQTGEVTAVVAAGFALVAAFLTSNVGVTIIVGALQAIAAVSIGFTYPHSAQVALYIGAVVALLGFLGHTQNSPKFGPRGTQPAVQGVSAQLASPLPAPPVLQAPWLEPQPEPAQEPVSVPVAASVTRPATVAPDTGDEKQRRASAAAKKGWETRRRKTQDPALS